MLRRLVLVFLLTFGSSGCSGDDDYYRSDYGTLIVDWTVEGTKARAACRDTGADAISIRISTGRGRLVDELEELCELFELSVDLLPGTYVVDAALLDLDGYVITTTVSDSLFVFSAEASVSAFDFPTDSFL